MNRAAKCSLSVLPEMFLSRNLTVSSNAKADLVRPGHVSIHASSSRRMQRSLAICANSPITPLCITLNRPKMNGWLLTFGELQQNTTDFTSEVSFKD